MTDATGLTEYAAASRRTALAAAGAAAIALAACGGGASQPDAARAAASEHRGQPQIHVEMDAGGTAEPPGRRDAGPVSSHVLVHDGALRSYDVVKPPTCISHCPVVIDLHGYTSNAAAQRRVSGMDRVGHENGAITVYPNGRFSSWNAGASRYGRCCGEALDSDVDDVGFIRAMLAKLRVDYPALDPRRVYATGISNGCAMSQRLAAEAGDLIAAVACSSLYLLTEQTTLPRPVSVTEIHGLSDWIVEYEGSSDWTGARANLDRWAGLNRCAGAPVRTPLTATSFKDEYLHCEGGTKVALYSLNGGHLTYRDSDGLDVAQIAWDALKEHRLPY